MAAASKQFGAWVIGLLDSYNADIFFRTRINVIGLQILFAAGMLFLFGKLLETVQSNIVQAIADGISRLAQSGGSLTTAEVIASIDVVRVQEFAKLFAVLVVATTIFGYIVARATLRPAHRALAGQKRFIADIAHEMRTPLSIIRTNSEVLLLDKQLRPKTRQVLEETVEELDRSANIIDNLLSINRFIRPERMEYRAVDFGKIIDGSVAKIARLAEEKGIALRAEKGAASFFVWGNTTALEQVAINLIKNAVAYTNDGGRVDVILEEDQRGSLLFTVKDTGIGISKRDLYHVFEPFYRTETSRGREQGGSGLGLAIVNEIVKLHHGSISIKSALGKGTTVRVVLPSARQELPTTRATDLQTDVEGNEVSRDFFAPRL